MHRKTHILIERNEDEKRLDRSEKWEEKAGERKRG